MTATAAQKAHVAQWKKDEVRDLTKMLKGANVVGIIDLENLPSPQFQEIRKKLRGKAEMRTSKSLLIKRAIEDTGRADLKPLETYMKGPTAVITSTEGPFSIYALIKKSRSKTLAKPGMIAPNDIIVEPCETDLPPGPALSELKIAGVNVKLDKGKIVVSSVSTVAKKGDLITMEKASALAKLGIKPITIGLNVLAMVENGMLYKAEVLDVDEDEMRNRFITGFRSALNLSVEAKIYNKYSTEVLVQKAARAGKAISDATATPPAPPTA